MDRKEHEYCLRCGRKLKSENSRLIGYGAVCEAKMKSEKSKLLFSPRNLGGENTQKEKPLD